jgi:starch synthase
VPDIGAPNNTGRGIRFTTFNLEDGHIAIYRAVELFHNEPVFEAIRERITEIDFSWERSAVDYQELYQQML